MPRPIIRLPEHVTGLVAENRRRYELLVEAAEHYAAQGDVERVLRWAMLAAHYAWLAPVGRLMDPRLERVVVHAVRGSGRPVVDGDRSTGRVLHVLSEAYTVGGHTRLAWRWMARDGRVSDLALTNHSGPVPSTLVEAVQRSGGSVHELAGAGEGLLDRAHALRELMDRADLVVLHVHPHDSIALAAVNLPGRRPPVVLDNHADHMFWLGAAGTDVVCDLRSQARSLDLTARGIPADRIGLLPMPVDELTSADGAGLRTELGIAAGAVVAVTMSAQYKMSPTWGKGMTHLLDRALHWAPRLSVVVVGAEPNGEWQRLSKRYPGRVVTVGRVPDPAPYFGIADLYLDSYPMTSATSTLEAAVLGIPVVALNDLPADDVAHMFQGLSPGLEGRPVPSSTEEFTRTVRRLVADPALRRQVGAEDRAAALARHDGPGWLSGMEALYQQARRLPACDVDDLGDPGLDDRYAALLALTHSETDESPSPAQLVGPLRDLCDASMHADLFAALSRDLGPSLLLRVAPGWGEHQTWTGRLVTLASQHPRLCVSLPFLDGDERDGRRTRATLMTVLDGIGLGPEDCGDINVDSSRPVTLGPKVSDELPFTDEAFAWLEQIVRSPLWSTSSCVDRGRSVAVLA